MAAAVGAGDDFEPVTVKLIPVQTAAAVIVIDLAFALPMGITSRYGTIRSSSRVRNERDAPAGRRAPRVPEVAALRCSLILAFVEELPPRVG